jgi:hypothetical protein
VIAFMRCCRCCASDTLNVSQYLKRQTLQTLPAGFFPLDIVEGQAVEGTLFFSLLRPTGGFTLMQSVTNTNRATACRNICFNLPLVPYRETGLTLMFRMKPQTVHRSNIL